MASSVDSQLSSASSSENSSAEEFKRRKRSSKKQKMHKEKAKKSKKNIKNREKRHKPKKHKKATSVREPEMTVDPIILTQSMPDIAEAAFGPALPPHLVKPIAAPAAQNLIGPIMPGDLNSPTSAAPDVSDDENTSTFGPVPVGATAMSAVQIELEERALSLKLAAIDGATGTEVEQKEREEWMLELPEVGLKSGLAALNNLKRTFHQGKERPDFSDRSSWTKTPQSAAAAISGPRPNTSKDLAKSAEALYERQRDAEQEQIAKKHKKKHKRDESLVELHQKKLRKEQRKREKELAASGAKPERRPFSRDVDLKLNKIDSQQTKHIVDKAKILNTKFSTGQNKYL